MEMKIIEVALALVLIYLVMALAATQINELWSGARKQRPKILTSAVAEAFNNQSNLVDDFFSYAPIFALSRDKRKPAAIPPDLFATAFLAVLNDKQPARSSYAYPIDFVNARKKPDDHLGQVLAAHVAGAEHDWNAFEARIARWYADIGDRSEGWYKRDTTLRLLKISAALTLALNVDSVFIARTLLENDGLRVALANVGELIADQRDDARRAAAGLAPLEREKLTSAAQNDAPFRVSNDLDEALGNVRAALAVAPELAAFGDNRGTRARQCVEQQTPPHTIANQDLYDSNVEAWTQFIVSIIGNIEEASLGISEGGNPGTEKASTPKGITYSDEWPDRIVKIRMAMVCTTGIAQWLRAAQYATKNKEAAQHLKAATAALERARENMQALIRRSSLSRHLARSYALLGQGFVDCTYEANGSRAVFDDCIGTARLETLPFGWPSRAGQFCQLSLKPLGASSSPTPPPPSTQRDSRSANRDLLGWDAWWGCQDFEEDSALRLPSIYTTATWPKIAAALFGWILTTVLVSLGAPFWYGLLGKVAQLRMAGRVRGLGDPQPESAKSPSAATPSGNGPLPGGPGAASPTPFDSARNEFERGLLPKEISRLQIALDLPPTMNLDEITRSAIAARLEALGQPAERELTPPTYFLIVGRNTTRVAADMPSSATWTIGTREPDAVRQLVGALNRLFSAGPARLAEREVFNHDLRARVVLFRLKSDPEPSLSKKNIVALARMPDTPLLRLDEATRRSILACKPSPAFAPDPQPWLDYAAGELGVDEISPEGVARVNEYLVATVGKHGMQYKAPGTAWCGAFVAWVLIRSGRLAAGKSHEHLLKAAQWKLSGTPTTGKRGDICMVDFGKGIHHVAFLIEIDALGGHWLLGGNQGSSTPDAVTLARFTQASSFTYVSTESIPPVPNQSG